MRPPEEERQAKPEEKPFQVYRQVAPFLTLGFQLAAAVVVLFFLGRWVDRAWGTSPFGQLVGVLLGSMGGLIKFFRATEELNKQEPTTKQDLK